MTQASICIPYFSDTGHTKALAQAIAQGAGRGHLMDVTQLSEPDWALLDQADMIVMGAPTYMGSTAARFDMFLEQAAERWLDQQWRDKMAAGFTVAIHPSGDKLVALQRLSTFAAQMGMIWVGNACIGAPARPENGPINRDGSWLGLMATATGGETLVSQGDQETARIFGARLAQSADRWRRGAT
ncbi:MAG: flavodoxin family protein [Pelagimonas sp.]|jgi:NAD(P)H dehydrogenase (quinone)|nr:flavodoxin family protein [Pelagimonas sp.]